MKDSANPNTREIVHTNHAGAPTVAEIAPIENSTRAGTPAATKNACFQSMARRMPWPTSSWRTSLARLLILIPLKGETEGDPLPHGPAWRRRGEISVL